MLFSKITSKLVGIIDADPIGDQDHFCISFRPETLPRKGWKAVWTMIGDIINNPQRRYFCTPWSEIFDSCFVVCPD